MRHYLYCNECKKETAQLVAIMDGTVRWCQECFHVHIVSDEDMQKVSSPIGNNTTRLKKKPGDKIPRL